MDLLFEDFVSPEQLNDIIVALSNAVSNSKHGLSKEGNQLKESRFFVKDRILIQENFIYYRLKLLLLQKVREKLLVL